MVVFELVVILSEAKDLVSKQILRFAQDDRVYLMKMFPPSPALDDRRNFSTRSSM
jgi:hypothetical protein